LEQAVGRHQEKTGEESEERVAAFTVGLVK
jgi:hypothetical protein